MSTLESDLACGYIRADALAEVDTLPPDTVRRLAAMAVTCLNSPFSDRASDLLIGVRGVLGRNGKPK